MKTFRLALVVLASVLFCVGNAVGQEETESDAAVDLKDFEKTLAKAKDGDADAMANLGYMYDIGQGVTQDYTEAVKWYRKAAELGHANAMYNLGVMHANGEGVIEDDKEAVKWFRKAAELGDAGAMTNLGFMYANGEGVIEDDVEAYAWFNVAAAKGMKMAAEKRDRVKKTMTPEQIAEGQKRSREIMKTITEE